MNVRARCEAEFRKSHSTPKSSAHSLLLAHARTLHASPLHRRVPFNSPDTPVHRARSPKMGMFHMPNVSAMTQTASRQEAALKRKTAEQGKPWYVRLVACFTCQCIC